MDAEWIVIGNASEIVSAAPSDPNIQRSDPKRAKNPRRGNMRPATKISHPPTNGIAKFIAKVVKAVGEAVSLATEGQAATQHRKEEWSSIRMPPRIRIILKLRPRQRKTWNQKAN